MGQTGHELAKKSSKIVPLGAPFPCFHRVEDQIERLLIRRIDIYGVNSAVRKNHLQEFGFLGVRLRNGVRDNKKIDWAVFVNLESPTPEEEAKITGILDAHGTSAGMLLDDFLVHPDISFVASGTFKHIVRTLKKTGWWPTRPVN